MQDTNTPVVHPKKKKKKNWGPDLCKERCRVGFDTLGFVWTDDNSLTTDNTLSDSLTMQCLYLATKGYPKHVH